VDGDEAERVEKSVARNFSGRKLYYVVKTVQKVAMGGKPAPGTARPELDFRICSDSIPTLDRAAGGPLVRTVRGGMTAIPAEWRTVSALTLRSRRNEIK
jgi:hypothetical protein